MPGIPQGRNMLMWACMALAVGGCMTSVPPTTPYITVNEFAGQMKGRVKEDWVARRVTVDCPSHKVVLTPGSGLVLVNDVPMHLSAPVKYGGGVLTVPVELVRVVRSARPLPAAPVVPPEPKPVPPVVVPPGPLPGRGKTVVIDAGHGGDEDLGGTVGRLREKDINLEVSREVARLLTEVGYRVRMTRTTDVAVGLEDRPAVANRLRADAFVSIHTNYVPSAFVQGVEVFYHDGGVASRTAASRRLAQCIHDHVVAATQDESRGVKEYYYRVLRLCNRPAALVEIGFLSHPGTRAMLAKSSHRRRVAEAIARGIRQYLEET